MDNHATNIPRMTAEEYFKAVPETSQPTELVEGEIVSLASPSMEHQSIAGGVYAELFHFIRQNGGKCKPFVSPADVRLDDRNVVQPDVFVTCKPENLTKQYLDGAPDFVAEVVSSNRSDDFIRKLYLYQNSGVREYWIIDPFHKKTVVYYFEDGNHPDIYTFDTPIPVGIYGGKLAIRIADFL